MRRAILIIAALSIFNTFCTNSLEESKPAGEQFKISVDPRIELLTIVMNYSEWDYYGKFKDSTYSYFSRVKSHFDEFKDHEAVKWFNEEGSDWNLDDPPTIMLWVSDPPNMKFIHPFPLHPTSQMDSNDAKKTIALLNKFAEDSDFGQFWQANQSFYKEYAADLKGILPFEKYTGMMCDFFKEEKAEFIFIPAPLINRASFGPQLTTINGEIPHFISGVSRIENGKPWKSRGLMRMLIFHEFGHSFINPLCEKYRAEIFKHEHLFEYLREDMSDIAYPDWFPTTHEHIVRSVQSDMMKLAGYESEADQDYKVNLRSGFSLLPFLREKIEYYSKNIEEYNSFADYFPQVLKVFEEVEPYKTRVPQKLAMGLKSVDNKKVLVRWISEKSPLYKFDILSGDTLISFNNKQMKTDEDIKTFFDYWYNASSGDKISLQVQRKEMSRSLNLTVPFHEKYKFRKKANPK